MYKEFDYTRTQTIGTVEFVSPKEIKVLLEINAPQSTAINTGIPQLFPKVNGFVLIPNESGALIGIISWIGIEYSPYPKNKFQKNINVSKVLEYEILDNIIIFKILQLLKK